MANKNNGIDRRGFLKGAAAAGLGSAFGSKQAGAEPNEPVKAKDDGFPQVPKRKFGKTGVEVSSLSLGMIFDVESKQIVLKKALQWGVTYWDTAHSYTSGSSERGIGKFLKRNPEVRKKLFIATKASGAKTVEEVEERLQTSLKRMNTSYVDVFYGVHTLNNISQLKPEFKPWAESAKKRGLIRFFGFTTHKNMTEGLEAGSKIDWIDAILTTYNFRVMQEPRFRAAIEACHDAGIAITAMKTQGLKIETDADKKLTDYFVQRGFTQGQAKIKAVLEDKRLSAACVGRDSVEHLTLNIAAVLDKTELTRADKDFLGEYARQTCDGYCAGCGNICEEAMPEVPYLSEIMRYLMYYNSYGDAEKGIARELYAKIPADVRSRLSRVDFSRAEARCPQKLAITKLVAEAARKLG